MSKQPYFSTFLYLPEPTGTFTDHQFLLRAENFFRGWNAIGVASNPQPNAGDATGAFYSTVSLDAKNQSRSSASDAYYRPIVGKRNNFHLITGQSVSKIDLDQKKRATAVNVGGSIIVEHGVSFLTCFSTSIYHGAIILPIALRQAVRSYSLLAHHIVLKSFSFRGSVPRSYSIVSRLRPWWIFQVSDITSMINHQCSCSSNVIQLF